MIYKIRAACDIYSMQTSNNPTLRRAMQTPNWVYQATAVKQPPHISPFLPSFTRFKLFSQSPQYPFTHACTVLSFFFVTSSIVLSLAHFCVSSHNQCSYSASTTSCSMRLTTRSATRRSCRCEPRLRRVRSSRRVLCVVGS